MLSDHHVNLEVEILVAKQEREFDSGAHERPESRFTPIHVERLVAMSEMIPYFGDTSECI